MTNREQILSMIGDELIASNLIECRKYYKTTEELHSGKYKVVYIFNEKTGKWLKDTEYMSDEFCQAVLAKWLAGMERG